MCTCATDHVYLAGYVEFFLSNINLGQLLKKSKRINLICEVSLTNNTCTVLRFTYYVQMGRIFPGAPSYCAPIFHFKLKVKVELHVHMYWYLKISEINQTNLSCISTPRTKPERCIHQVRIWLSGTIFYCNRRKCVDTNVTIDFLLSLYWISHQRTPSSKQKCHSRQLPKPNRFF